jgi:hypothetical protein
LSFPLTDRRVLTGGMTDSSRERFSDLRKARNLGLKHEACQCIFYDAVLILYQLLNAAGFSVEEFFDIHFFSRPRTLRVGRDSSVGIATWYGLDGPGIESRWGEIFRIRPDRPCGPPRVLHDVYWVFRGGGVIGAWR